MDTPEKILREFAEQLARQSGDVYFKKLAKAAINKADQASTATPRPQSVHPDALEALKNYQQADESGVMVLVSRQALDEAIRTLIEPLSADEHKEHQDKYHDLIALRASRKVMALNNEPVMPTSQLQARIQCIIYDAIKELP